MNFKTLLLVSVLLVLALSLFGCTGSSKFQKIRTDGPIGTNPSMSSELYAAGDCSFELDIRSFGTAQDAQKVLTYRVNTSTKNTLNGCSLLEQNQPTVNTFEWASGKNHLMTQVSTAGTTKCDLNNSYDSFVEFTKEMLKQYPCS